MSGVARRFGGAWDRREDDGVGAAPVVGESLAGMPMGWQFMSNSDRAEHAALMRARRSGATADPGALASSGLAASLDRANQAPSSAPPSSAVRVAEQLGLGDRSNVRIHTGAEAAAVTAATEARAVTSGQHIHFSPGEYNPASASGQQLLGHELAHTAQQAGTPATAQAKLRVSDPQDSAEIEADRYGVAHAQAWRDDADSPGALTGRAPVPVSSQPTDSLARSPRDRAAAADTNSMAPDPSKQEPAGADDAGVVIFRIDPAENEAAEADKPSESQDGAGELATLTPEELEFLQMLLMQATAQQAAEADARANAARSTLSRRAGPKEREEVVVQVPLDRSLLETPEPRVMLQVRAFQAGLNAYGVDWSRMEVRHFRDSVARADARNAYMSLGGTEGPTNAKVREFVKRRLDAGRTSFEMRVTGIPTMLATYERVERERITAINEFKAKMANSTYAQDAILSFYIAHLNAPINAINDLMALAVTPVNQYGGAPIPRIPTIPYKGEWGQKNAAVLDAGGSIGITLPLGALGLFTRAGVGVEAAAARLTVGGIRVGPGIVKVGKAYMVGAAALQVKMAVDDISADIAIVRDGTITIDGVTRQATPEERQAAYDRIVDRFLGLAAGVAVGAAATGQSRGPRGNRPPPASVVNDLEEAHGVPTSPSRAIRGEDGQITAHGGKVLYRPMDDLGRPTGVQGTLTPDMVNTGTDASKRIHPPGWKGHGTKHNQARAHLLAKVLGGSGDLPENLVTLEQRWANSPVMRDFELSVADALDRGETVRYVSTPLYDGANPIPRGVSLLAEGDQGFYLHVTVVNPQGR